MGINALVIIVLALLIYNVAEGFSKGCVRKFISAVSLILMGIFVVLAANGISGYLSGKIINVIVAILLLGILVTVKVVLKIVFFPLKILSKLPIVSWADKLLGIIFGLLETVAIVWALYALMMVLNLGGMGDMIWTWTKENSILTWLYDHNLVVSTVKNFVSNLKVPTTYIIK